MLEAQAVAEIALVEASSVSHNTHGQCQLLLLCNPLCRALLLIYFVWER